MEVKTKKKRSEKYFENQLIEEKNKTQGLKNTIGMMKGTQKEEIKKKNICIDRLIKDNKKLRSEDDRKKLTDKITDLENQKAVTKKKHKKQLADKKSEEGNTIKGLNILLQKSQQSERYLLLILKKNNVKI